MRSVWIVFQREMRSYFASPVAYVVLIAFLGLAGWSFYRLALRFMVVLQSATEQAMTLQQMPPVANVNLGVVQPWFGFTGVLMLFLAPIITMRLLADERGTGRLDLLLSAPITELQLVLGKLLAGMALVVIFLIPTVAYPGVLFAYGNPELGQILAGYLGLVLLAAALIGLGLAVSSLTGSQVVAAVGGLAAAIVFWLIGPANGDTSVWNTILSEISLQPHFVDFSTGVIELKNVVYFLSFIIFMVFIARRSVESQRWRG